MNTEQIEDIYPLSWMQQGMLFHTLYAQKSGVYFNQLHCTLNADLNVSAFEQAWRRVIDRHPILRTSFVWEDLAEPVQIVHRQLDWTLEQQDWREHSAVEQPERLESFLRADRDRGFDLSEAPLMRLYLIRTTEDAYEYVWSRHHILLDAWSGVLLQTEFATFYEAFSKGHDVDLERPRPYRDYINWLRQQDLSKAQAFWQRMLKGFSAPTPLAGEFSLSQAPAREVTFHDVRTRLSLETTTALQALARKQQLTLNTVLQGAWAILLGRYSSQADVVFGTTVAGRPMELAGVESMVGNFINTLPVRIKIPAEAQLMPWLKQLQLQQAEMRQHEYTPLVEIQSWSEVPRGQPLFESLLVVQNYSVADLKQSRTIKASRSGFVERSNYPIAVVVALGAELGLRLTYDQDRFSPDQMAQMLEHLATLLRSMVVQPTARLSELEMLCPEESKLLQKTTSIEELEASFSF